MKQILFWVVALTLGFSASAAVPLLCAKFFETTAEWAQVFVSFFTFVTGIIGFGVAYRKWQEEVRQKRAESFKAIMTGLSKNKLWCAVRDSSTDQDNDIEDELSTQSDETHSLLALVAYLLYLRKQKHIDDAFVTFEFGIRRLLSRKAVIQILNETTNAAAEANMESPYKYILDYREETGLVSDEEGAIVPERASEKVDSADSSDADGNEAVFFPQEEGRVLTEADFQEPTMLIRISRQFHEGIRKRELYESTRKWWRIVPKDAVRYAMSVVQGKIIAVFCVQKWELGVGEVSGRSAFVGEYAPKALSEKYIGGSVKGFFPKGAANPIRYVGLRVQDKQGVSLEQ